MEIYKIEKNKKERNEELNEKKINVAAYVRVSSRENNGPISFESQKIYYENKIKSNPNWNFVGIYADEGISGANIKKRSEFKRMIYDIENHKIDLVLTKSISRFSRNTLDTLNFVRKLKEYNVAIIFEEENINTLEMNGELIITILSSIAQQEVHNLSESVKYGIHENMRNGKISGRYASYGYSYDSENRTLIINEKEAKNVRLIFESYLELNSLFGLIQKLHKFGIKTKTGKEYWAHSTLCSMLKDPKYIGTLVMGKYYINNPIDKVHKKNRGSENMYVIKNHHEAIVSEELFNKVQEALKKNINPHISTNIQEHLYSHKLKCYYCRGGLRICKTRWKTYYKCDSEVRGKHNTCRHNRYYDINLLDTIVHNSLEELKKNKKICKNGYLTEQFNKELNDQLLKEIIEYIIAGDEESPYTLSIVLKPSDFVNKKITAYTLELKDCRKVFEYLYKSKKPIYYKDKDRKAVEKTFEVKANIYIDEVF